MDRVGLREEAARSSSPGQAALGRLWRPLSPFDPWRLWPALDGSAFGRVRFAWTDPGSQLTLLACGTALVAEAEDEARLRHLRIRCSELREQIDDLRPAPAAAPLAVTGFGFGPSRGQPGSSWASWAPACVIAPTLLLWSAPGGGGVAIVARARRRALESDLDKVSKLIERTSAGPVVDAQRHVLREELAGSEDQWRSKVLDVKRAIETGTVDKIVLARSRASSPPRGHRFDPIATAHNLRSREPQSFTFAVRGPGAWLVGATPELLARVRGRRVEAAALAGTARRGSDREADDAIGAALLASSKDRLEHDIVTSAIEMALGNAVRSLDPLPAPRLLKLSTVQHLLTPISGDLLPGEDLLSIASRLHPTPAIGGAPKAAALAWIRANEGLDRGWYAGGIGWTDTSGGGTLAVTLRCARIAPLRAEAFAGAGIVAASSPELEWAETELKLSAIESALATRTVEGEA